MGASVSQAQDKRLLTQDTAMDKDTSKTYGRHSRTRKPKTAMGKIGTVYPQPMLWRNLWGFKVYI